jgi:membrane-associated protein
MDVLTTSTLVVFVVLAALVALDAVMPVVPAEAAVISAVVLASAGHGNVLVVAAATVTGAVLGDQAAYAIGRRLSVLPLSRLLPRPRVRRALVRALDGLLDRSLTTLVAVRFVPFGRTAAATMAGYLRFPRPLFLLGTTLGAIAWTAYCLLLGHVGGFLVGGPVIQQAVVSIAVGVLVGLGLDAVRRVIEVRRRLAAIEAWEVPATVGDRMQRVA